MFEMIFALLNISHPIEANQWWGEGLFLKCCFGKL